MYFVMKSRYYFYRRYLNDDVLSMNARILRSWLLSEVVLHHYDAKRDVGEWLSDGRYKLAEVRYGNFPKEFGMSRHCFNVALGELMESGIWDGDSLSVRVSVYRDGWFHFRTDGKLSGNDLVLYSWLCDRAELAGGTMTDVPASKVSPLFGVGDGAIRKRRLILYKKGYCTVEKSKDGHCYCNIVELEKDKGKKVFPKYNECGDYRALSVGGFIPEKDGFFGDDGMPF